MFDGLWPGFDDTEVPITSITNGVHAPTWVDRKVYRAGGQAPGHHRPGPRQRLGADRCRPRRRDLGDQARAARAAGQGGPPPGALLVGQARREPGRARLGRQHPRPRRPDHRLRPPGADVQAADPDPARPRAAEAAAAGPGAPDPARHRRQVPPGRRDRQEADPADGEVRRRPRGPAPHRLPAQLRHRHGAVPLPRLRRLAEQPAAPVRGVRHVGDEGRAQRRPQPLDPRRLVGRVVRRRERLGHPDRGRRRGPRPSRRPRGGGALRPDRDLGRAALLRPRRRRAAPALAVDDDPHPDHARPEGARLAAGARTTSSELYGPAARAGWALNGPEYAGAKSLAAFKAKVRGAWSGVRVDHVESSGVSDSPQVGRRAARAGVRRPWASCRPTTSRCRSCTGARPSPTTCGTSRPRR